jgi:integrase
MIFLEPVEVLSVLRAATAKGERRPMRAVRVLLAYKHGMRASEVCDLRLEDIDMKNGQHCC